MAQMTDSNYATNQDLVNNAWVKNGDAPVRHKAPREVACRYLAAEPESLNQSKSACPPGFSVEYM